MQGQITLSVSPQPLIGEEGIKNGFPKLPTFDLFFKIKAFDIFQHLIGIASAYLATSGVGKVTFNREEKFQIADKEFKISFIEKLKTALLSSGLVTKKTSGALVLADFLRKKNRSLAKRFDLHMNLLNIGDIEVFSRHDVKSVFYGCKCFDLDLLVDYLKQIDSMCRELIQPITAANKTGANIQDILNELNKKLAFLLHPITPPQSLYKLKDDYKTYYFEVLQRKVDYEKIDGPIREMVQNLLSEFLLEPAITGSEPISWLDRLWNYLYSELVNAKVSEKEIVSNCELHNVVSIWNFYVEHCYDKENFSRNQLWLRDIFSILKLQPYLDYIYNQDVADWEQGLSCGDLVLYEKYEKSAQVTLSAYLHAKSEYIEVVRRVILSKDADMEKTRCLFFSDPEILRTYEEYKRAYKVMLEAKRCLAMYEISIGKKAEVSSGSMPSLTLFSYVIANQVDPQAEFRAASQELIEFQQSLSEGKVVDINDGVEKTTRYGRSLELVSFWSQNVKNVFSVTQLRYLTKRNQELICEIDKLSQKSKNLTDERESKRLYALMFSRKCEQIRVTEALQFTKKGDSRMPDEQKRFGFIT